jgi:hypothetical protein
MRVANTEVGGLAGGLYEAFESLGLGFFNLLIGAVRAQRPELEYERVSAGATLVGVGLGIVIGILFLPALTSGSSGNSLGCSLVGVLILGPFIGGLLVLALVSVIVHYIKRLRAQDVRSASASASGASFDTIFAEAHKRYLDSGYPPRDAQREAWWFAALSTGAYRS